MSRSQTGSLLRLQRDKSKPQLVWESDLDRLIGPFRSHRHKELQKGYTDHCGFQAVWTLGMSEEDLEEGDNCLKGHFGVVDKTP